MNTDELFTKEKRLTLRARATSQVRQAILSGGLKPGTRLIEQELSEKMGTSRLPIREALASLEKEGLVTVEPYKGAFVREVSAEEIEELYPVRSLLEVYALQLALRRSAPELECTLRDIVKKMDEISPDANRELVLLDFSFHETICRLSGNSTLYKLWRTLALRIQMYLNVEMQHNTQDNSISNLVSRHKELCEIIASQDTMAALTWLTGHLESGKTILQVCLMQTSPSA